MSGMSMDQVRRNLERAGARYQEQWRDDDGDLVLGFQRDDTKFVAILLGERGKRYAACMLVAGFAGRYDETFAADLNRSLTFAKAVLPARGDGIMISYSFPLERLNDESAAMLGTVYLMDLARLN